MFENVQAEVDDLKGKGFGEESLIEVFKTKGAKGIRALHLKEIIKNSKDRMTLPDSKGKTPWGKAVPMPTLKEEKQWKKKIIDRAYKEKNYAYGGRVAKSSMEKS